MNKSEVTASVLLGPVRMTSKNRVCLSVPGSAAEHSESSLILSQQRPFSASSSRVK